MLRTGGGAALRLRPGRFPGSVRCFRPWGLFRKGRGFEPLRPVQGYQPGCQRGNQQNGCCRDATYETPVSTPCLECRWGSGSRMRQRLRQTVWSQLRKLRIS